MTLTHFISYEEFPDNFNVGVSDSATYISVPFHYQNKNYYCGPAALKMVFDYYGEDISQTEIADVARTHPYVTYTDELRRAAHFSNLSTSLGNEMPSNISGYSTRKVGYATFEHYGLTIDDLKTLINKEEPLIVLMWWTPSKVYGHYRVVIGHNDTHIIMHDPWNKDIWGGTYGGANTSMTYSTFLDLWEYSGNWGLLVRPWDIELQMPSTISEDDDFEVTANITYSCSTPFDTADYPAYSCKATIELQENLELALGETTQHSLGNIIAGDSVQTSWSIHATKPGLNNISVTVTGIIEGSVGIHGTYPYYDYEDEIGGLSISSLSVVIQAREVHNLNTALNYTTIQEAINAPETLGGHTILVDSRTYYEHLTIDKSISLIGENKFNTIIDGSGTGIIVSVTAKNVSLSNLTLRRAGFQPPIAGAILVSETTNSVIEDVVIVDNDPCGITLFNSTNSKVSRSEFFNNTWAVLLVNSNENMIVDNVISKNSYGIALGGPEGSSNNLLADNLISNNVYHGIDIFGFDNKVSSNRISNNDNGVLLDMASGNLIVSNNLSNNSQFGVYLIRGSEGNTINGNTVQFNHVGVFVKDYSRNNALHCNNFINNTKQVYLFESSVNTWDNGYPSGGNYWSDYEERYPKAKELDGSGIWDIPYVIDEDNKDNYPLMKPWTPIPPVITATIDVDPDTLNLKSRGKWITAYIEHPEYCSTSDDDRTTILLNDTIPVDPFWIDKPLDSVVGDHDEDGIRDLMVKFDRAEVIEFIFNAASLLDKKFDYVTLTLTGQLTDGTPFGGSDAIRIVLPYPSIH